MFPKKEFSDVIYNVLTPSDLYEKMAELIEREKNPSVVITYGQGHLFIGHKKFNNGLSISTDGLGMWEIRGLTTAPDESYQYTSEMVKTERTETVARAVAVLMIDWNESEQG
jgi:D-mannonate dehydratase